MGMLRRMIRPTARRERSTWEYATRVALLERAHVAQDEHETHGGSGPDGVRLVATGSVPRPRHDIRPLPTATVDVTPPTHRKVVSNEASHLLRLGSAATWT